MDETIEPRPQRRRSSILPRRSIALAPTAVSEDHPKDTKAIRTNVEELKTPRSSEDTTVNVADLKSYLANLTTERLAWKSLREERKLLKTSVNGTSAPLSLTWDSAQEFLSEEDVTLMNNLPSYDNIYASYDSLMVEAARLNVKYKRISNLAHNIQRIAQCRLHSIKVKIGEYSENNVDVPH